MAKATTTIIQRLNYEPQYAAYFAANQQLFNSVVAFYFNVIAAHDQILRLKTKEALTALETLTHATEKNPHPVMPLTEVCSDLPAMLRRAAINAALGSAKSFQSHLKRWRTRKEKAEARGKTFTDRPPVPPRTWNKSVPFYAGVWRERTENSILLKVWTGACWSWVKVRISGRDLPEGYEIGSPQLIRHGGYWWLHTPIEQAFEAPKCVEEQAKNTPHTTICAVDLNVGEQIGVCTIQTVEGTILATTFLGGGKVVNGFRKRQLGRIACHRSRTGTIAEGEQDNADLWQKIRHRDDDEAHRISRRIVQFAKAHGASIIVFEHLGNLRPQKGKYSRRSNTKRAYWMKGRIFRYAKYKAWNERIITCRVNPRNTSRQCARCGASVIRYAVGWHPPDRLYRGCAARVLSRLPYARQCRSQRQPQHWKAAPGSLSAQSFFPFTGKASRSPGTFRQGSARSRCDRLPGSPKRKSTIYGDRKAWRLSRAWHRPDGDALDGGAPIIYSSPTTALQ